MALIRKVTKLTELYNDYQRTHKTDLSPSSYSLTKQAKEKLDELFPRLTINQINPDMVRFIYNELSKYPTYRNTKFADLTLPQCYLHADYAPIKPKTVKLVFNYLKLVIGWARENKIILNDEVLGYLKLPKAKKESISKSRGQLILPTSKTEKIQNKNKAVLPWTNELLKKVFNTHIFKNDRCDNATGRPRSYIPLHYWLFPMAYCMGMRAREIAQLSLDDVIEIDGYYGVTVNDAKPYQRVKSLSSRRFVPLHDSIIELGFLEFVAWRRGFGTESDLLFLTPITAAFLAQDGAHNRISQAIRKEAGLLPRSGYNTHSFRHLFIDELRSSGIAKWQIASVVGHDSNDHSSITDEYGINSMSVDQLHLVVNQFNPPIEVICKWSDFKNTFL